MKRWDDQMKRWDDQMKRRDNLDGHSLAKVAGMALAACGHRCTGPPSFAVAIS